MSEPLTPLGSVETRPDITLDTLVQAHRSLRTAFHVSLVLLFILAGSLGIFFIRELSIARRQINDLTQVVAEYERSAVPLMEDFRTKLQGFARSHSDFAPIYTKYFGTNAMPLGQGPARVGPAVNPPGARLPPGP